MKLDIRKHIDFLSKEYNAKKCNLKKERLALAEKVTGLVAEIAFLGKEQKKEKSKFTRECKQKSA